MKTLLTITLLFVCMVSGQIKIDNIELTRAEAKEYFLDCQTFPDTIWVNACNGGYLVTDYIKNLDKECLGKTYEMQIPSKEMQEANAELKKKGIRGSISDGSEWKRFGWIIPRKPSAFDYAKYIRRIDKINSSKPKPRQNSQ